MDKKSAGHGSTMPNGQIIEQALTRTQKRNKRRRDKLKQMSTNINQMNDHLSAAADDRPPSSYAAATAAAPLSNGDHKHQIATTAAAAAPLLGFAQLIDGEGIDARNCEMNIGGQIVRPRLLCSDPVIVMFDNVVTCDEADAIIKLAGPRWGQSSTTNGLGGDYSRQSTIRTSSSAAIGNLPARVIRTLAKRFRLLTGIRHVQFDLLRYEKGQEFRTHHDGVERTYTFVLYLNDLLGDDDGGETEFPTLGLRVKPKRGSALFFANCRSGSASADLRVLHGALPVRREGVVKYVVNSWIIANPSALAQPHLVPEQDI
jgi:prolyl 4-hydroxylase